MNLENQEIVSENLDFKEILQYYTKRWRWFLFSVIVCLALTFIYIRYQIPEYLAQATLKIEDPETSSEMSVFRDLEVFSSEPPNAVDDEILIVKSRAYMMEVATRLKLNIQIFAQGKIIETELYNNAPFKLSFISPDTLINNANFEFYLRISSDNAIGYSEDKDSSFKTFQFGTTIVTPLGDLIITPKFNDSSQLYGNRYHVVVRPLAFTAQTFKDKIKIEPERTGSQIINVYLQDPTLAKGKDVINTLIEVYNTNTLADKKAIADKTSSFINVRINALYDELSTVDQTAQEFKSDRKLTDIASQSNLNLTENAAYEGELQNAQIQLNIASSIKDIIDNSEGYDVLPAIGGFDDPSIIGTSSNYNELVLQRKRLLESSNENNPVIRNLDQQLESLRQNIRSSLNNSINNLNLRANSLSQRISTLNSRLYSAPGNERTLRDITRKQETKEALYLYLLQKREESQIAFASSEPKIRLIDRAYSLSNRPVGLDSSIIYLGSLFLGLIIPFSILYVNDLLDTKIHNKMDLEKIIKGSTILGELPKLSKKDSKLILEDDRSVLAEAMRILRTNLYYVLNSKGIKTEKGKVVMVTSSVPNEGKTFLSSNLAILLAKANHKVLLVGGDIRNPRIKTFLKENQKHRSKDVDGKQKGLTDYLHKENIGIDKILTSEVIYNSQIDIVYSGKVPPNPTELLMSERLGEFFLELSASYDYIIVDTSPLLGVTDTLVMSKYADHIIYMTRAGRTEKKVLNYPIKLKEEGRLKNFSFVVNAVEEGYLGYGGIYGYGYDQTKKKRWFARN